MIINKLPIKYNYSKRINEMKYIVVHDTGNPRKGAGALNHYHYFNGGYRGASAHYFVDDSMIVQLIPDNEIAYHANETGRSKIAFRWVLQRS